MVTDMGPALRAALRSAAPQVRGFDGGLTVEVIHRFAPAEGEVPPPASLQQLVDMMATMKEAIDRMRVAVERTEGRMASVVALCQSIPAMIRDNAGDPAELTKLADELEARAGDMAAAVEAVPVPVRPGDVQPPREEVNEAGFPVGGTAPIEPPAPSEPAAPPAATPVDPVATSEPAPVEPAPVEPVPAEPPPQ